MTRAVRWLLLPVLLGACVSTSTQTTTTAPAPTRPPPVAPGTGQSLLGQGMAPPQALHWTRTSAEHRAILLQSYRGASQKLRELAANAPRGTWAVVMDADETVLDNSLYFQRQAEQGLLDFGFRSWIDFVNQAIAPPLPGAVEFTRLVGELGGRVVIVTNRAENLCPPTRVNLERAGIPVAAVVCKPPNVDDKTPRYRAVENGEVEGLPALRVLMYVGDNIQDFPVVTQASMRDAADSAYSEFGNSWWILPNPLYGSWQRNPMPADPGGSRQ